jgi:phosphoribosylformimino-5-aminoimidazole carboxamide ribotide isomerase
MMLIPAIDLRGGRCVRLRQGDFRAETIYPLSPQELLQQYRALGASWLHVVDLDGARDGVMENRGIILALASQRAVRLQAGGGVRSAAIVEDLLRLGVARVVVGSTAIDAADEVAGWLATYGGAQIVLAFDVRIVTNGDPEVQTSGWTRGSGTSLWAAVERFAACGLTHVLCTDVERDGTLDGPNLALYAQCVERFPGVRWQASGGVRDAADLTRLAGLGVAAAVSGKALLEQRISPEELRSFLPDASSPASTSATAAS